MLIFPDVVFEISTKLTAVDVWINRFVGNDLRESSIWFSSFFTSVEFCAKSMICSEEKSFWLLAIVMLTPYVYNSSPTFFSFSFATWSFEASLEVGSDSNDDDGVDDVGIDDVDVDDVGVDVDDVDEFWLESGLELGRLSSLEVV